MRKSEKSLPLGATDTQPQKTVLIVEDEVATRYMAGEYLRASGFRVLEAKDADEAISLLSAGKQVSAVFSDVQMSGSMDGLCLAEWIAQRYPDVPVLLTSGSHPDRLPACCREFFIKPCSLEDLEVQIRAIT